MIIHIAELIQQSELAQLLRNSLWLYPLINTSHIIGIALLLGSTLAIDFRLLGLWPSTHLKSVATVSQTLTWAGIIMAITFGLLLFIARPIDYLQSQVFIIKLMLIVIALVNAIILMRSRLWKNALIDNHWGFRLKAQALLSVLLWLTVVFLGRLIGYR